MSEREGELGANFSSIVLPRRVNWGRLETDSREKSITFSITERGLSVKKLILLATPANLRGKILTKSRPNFTGFRPKS